MLIIMGSLIIRGGWASIYLSVDLSHSLTVPFDLVSALPWRNTLEEGLVSRHFLGNPLPGMESLLIRTESRALIGTLFRKDMGWSNRRYLIQCTPQ